MHRCDCRHFMRVSQLHSRCGNTKTRICTGVVQAYPESFELKLPAEVKRRMDEPTRNRERRRGASGDEDEDGNGERDRKAGWRGMSRRDSRRRSKAREGKALSDTRVTVRRGDLHRDRGRSTLLLFAVPSPHPAL